MVKILFIGDIVGKPGRKILRQVLPEWKEKYKPDAIVVNVENLAHGKGVTPSTLGELDDLGIDCYTSGNHIFNKNDLSNASFDKYPKLIRPANFGDQLPGHGYYRFSKTLNPHPSLDASGHLLPSAVANALADKEGEGGSREQQFLILNLNANVFMEKQFEGTISNPFLALDKLLLEQGQKGDIILIDFHSEATSEKIAFGYYCDGRVTAVLGTHTHVPTADNRVLPNGTVFMSDVGMTGARDGVIGVKYQNVLKKFLEPETKFKNELEEDGTLQINGVLIETSADGKAVGIERVYQELV
jgi:calcineurin-like phosphoesterase